MKKLNEKKQKVKKEGKKETAKETNTSKESEEIETKISKIKELNASIRAEINILTSTNNDINDKFEK